MSRTCKTKNSNIYENEDGVVQEEDKNIDAKMDKLLDHYTDSDQLEPA